MIFLYFDFAYFIFHFLFLHFKYLQFFNYRPVCRYVYLFIVDKLVLRWIRLFYFFISFIVFSFFCFYFYPYSFFSSFFSSFFFVMFFSDCIGTPHRVGERVLWPCPETPPPCSSPPSAPPLQPLKKRSCPRSPPLT